MTDEHQLIGELEETFRAELEERLETMNGALLELEQGVSAPRRSELLQSLFRDAHSLKGGAQLIGRTEVAAVAHAAEARLAALRTAGDVSAAELAPLFAAAGTIARLAARSPVSPSEVDRVVASLEPKLEALGVETTDDRVGRHFAAEAGLVPDEVPPTPGGGPPAPAAVVRVSAERLDTLLSRSGELIAARDAAERQRRRLHDLAGNLSAREQQWGEVASASRRLARGLPESPLRRLLADVDGAHTGLVEAEREARSVAGDARVAAQRFGQLVDQLEAELRDLRMVPVARLFRPFARMVRDLGESAKKRVQLRGIGWDTAVDRELLEQLKDPVMHLLRNAVDHGIETPAVRRARGKPATASVTLEARRDGDRVVIEVRDDGGGIDREAVLGRAAAEGRPRADAGIEADSALRAIFAPGFSTLDIASAVSGRGVGLDVVATRVAELGGTVGVRSDASGTAFTLRVPLTLISTRVLVVRVGEHRYALPIDAVVRVLRFGVDETSVRGGRQAIAVGGRPYVVADLGATLGLKPTPVDEGQRLLGLLVMAAGAVVAFVVEAIEGEREVVVKQLGAPVGRTPLIAGAALVDQDDVVLVLDHVALASSITGASGRLEPTSAPAERRRDPERPLRVLVADDSITTRTLEKNILSAAGFDVALAADGREALRTVRLEPFDLVVSDVDMPGIDGFELTERLRSNEATRDLPVILVTGKERPEDRERGMRAGADAYVLKSEFDHQALLKTIREVVG